jgi:hypothetical protein
MTAHRPKPTITPERVAWFRAYYAQNSEWGVFHVSLCDENFNCGAADTAFREGTGVHDPATRDFIPERHDVGRDEWDPELREAAEWFDKLTPSQRRRLRKKVGGS